MRPNQRVLIDYTNWRGERRTRLILPVSSCLQFHSTEWHPEPQWLMKARDEEEGKIKDFAMSGIHSWTPESAAAKGSFEAQTSPLRAAAQIGLAYAEDQLRLILESECVTDDEGCPIRGTLDDDCVEEVETIERDIAAIKAALEASHGQ